MTFSPNPGRYESMHYRRSGSSGLDLPAVSLGLLRAFGVRIVRDGTSANRRQL